MKRIAVLMTTAVVVAACTSGASETTDETNPPTSSTAISTTTTSAVLSLDTVVATPLEAFCTGMVVGTESFGDGMEGVEYFDIFSEMTWPICVELPRGTIQNFTEGRGIDIAQLTLENAYIFGCSIPAGQRDIATYGPYAEDTFPDTETRLFFDQVACATPLRNLQEIGREWEILRRGVCGYRDTPLSDAQVESGMLRCP